LIVTLLVFNDEWIGKNAQPSDYSSQSMITFTSLIFINAFTVLMESNYLTWLNHLIIWGTVLFYFFLILIVDTIPSNAMYGIIVPLFYEPAFWFTVLITCVLAIIPVKAMKDIMSILGVNPFNVIKYEQEKILNRFRSTANSDTERIPSNITPLLESHKRKNT